MNELRIRVFTQLTTGRGGAASKPWLRTEAEKLCDERLDLPKTAQPTLLLVCRVFSDPLVT